MIDNTTINLCKKDLIVNGVKRTLLVNENDSLVDVIRKQLTLTGTKVGCRLNQCGICSLILNGKLVRSCMIKMNKVPDDSEVLTIEGIGTPDNLHPLQVAWIKYGGAQCGICTPGFIVSSYALLKENINPTREEVREWFRKNKNACRCTGYKVLVDAVMAAAKVMRGEMDIEELGFKMGPDGRIFGTDYPRPSAIAKVTGTCDYGADTGAKMPPGTFLQLAIAQAKVSHANIISIDTSEAEKMPGVEAVLTHKDVQGNNRINGLVLFPWNKNDGYDRPMLCDEKIFQYGDAIAIVCADTAEHARAAADKVKVEVEELPAYLDVKEAASEDAIEVHPGVPNVFFEQNLVKGPDPDPILDNSYIVLEHEYYSQRQPHLVLEPDVGYAYFDEEGRLTIQSKSIGVYVHRDMICEGLGLEPEKIRVIQNNAGGTFGYKMSPTMEAILGIACMATGKPVYLEFDMHQQLTYTGKRSPGYINVKLGVDENGKMTAMKADVLSDHGAYSEFGDLLLLKPLEFTLAGYHLESMRNYGRMCFSNHAYGAAMRAFGAPEAFFAGESMVDEMAHALGMDPFEFRYQNLYNENSTTPTGCSPDVLVLKELFDMMKPKYEAARKAQAEAPVDPNKKRGVGISLGIYTCGDDGFDQAEAAMELLPDGKIAVYNTWEDHGQGADMGVLASAHEALRPMNVDPEDIVLVSNDTARCPNSSYAAGSRSQIMVGNAIWDAAENLMKAMKKDDGTYRTYNEMKAESLDTYYAGLYSTTETPVNSIDEKTMQFNPVVAYMYGVFLSEVEVDITTGKTQVIRITGAYDVGKIANMLVVEGQAYGGLMQGIGMALSEEFDDLKAHTTLAKSGFPYIDMIPDEMELMFLETPRTHSKLGCSGAGESVTSAPHVAVINAIDDACGARIRRMPAYPERVLEALKNKNK